MSREEFIQFQFFQVPIRIVDSSYSDYLNIGKTKHPNYVVS